MQTTGTGEWSKSPKHLLREAAVRDMTSGWEAGPFVEFGVGRGAMTTLFASRGFTGQVYDLGEDTRHELRRTVFPDGGSVEVVDKPEEIGDGSASYLMAFEVLEHVEDDLGVLSAWARKLRPGGRVLITVPAHMRKFSATDRRVGHVRRYERDELERLLRAAGFVEIRVANYGFPLGNITRRVMRRLESQEPETLDRQEQVGRSVRSGVEQPAAVNRLSKFVNLWTLAPFLAAQRAFYAQDRGDGYVATGVLGP